MKRITVIVALVLVAAGSCAQAQLVRVDPWGFGGNDLYEAIAPDASTMIVAGEGVILRSEDNAASWQVVANPGGVVNGVHFISATDGVAVTSEGMIYRTTTSGRQWTPAPVRVEQLLMDVAFGTAGRGLVVGSRGILLHTSDAGATWTIDSIDADRYLYDVDMLPSGAMVIGASDGLMFVSDDAGQTWRSRSSGISDNFYSVHFIDTTKGWAAGSAGIYATTDAGVTWTQQLAGKSIQRLHFTSATSGFAAGDSGEYFVTDNGTSWRAVSVGDPAGVFAVLPSAGNLVAVGSLGYIARSTDNGASWTQTGSSKREHLFAIDFNNDTRGFAAGERGLVLRTTDEGSTWTQMRIPGEPGLSTIVAGEQAKVWAAGADGFVHRSDDDGQTWTSSRIPNLAGVAKLSRSDDATIWAAGGGGIHLSTDGGASWRQRYADASRYFYSVASLGATHAIAVADSGVAMRTTDGGATWQPIATQTAANIYDVALSNNAATLAGDNGIVMSVDMTSGTSARVVVDSLAETVWAVLPFARALSTTTGDVHARVASSRWARESMGLPARGLDGTSRAVFAAGAFGSIWRLAGAIVSAPSEQIVDVLTIYPNPVADALDVRVPPGAGPSAGLRMTNSNGVIVRTMSIDSDIVHVPTSELPAGTYIISVLTRDGIPVAQGQAVVVR